MANYFTMGAALIYLLIVFRIMGCLMILPFFGSRTGIALKGALAIMLAFLVYPAAGLGRPGPALDLYFLVLAAQEVLLGLMMGFVVILSFGIVSVAGEMISQEMGFRISIQVDPLTGNRTPAISQFYQLFAFIFFIGINGHYWVLEILCRSFRVSPLGSLNLDGGFGNWMVGLFTHFFTLGIQLAAPLFLLMLMISIGIGMLTKLVEGMNVLDIGFPIRIGVGLLFIMLLLPYLGGTLHRIFGTIQDGLMGLLSVL